LLQSQGELTHSLSLLYLEHVTIRVNPVISFQARPAFRLLHMFDV
jgi:hypothetical protein